MNNYRDCISDPYFYFKTIYNRHFLNENYHINFTFNECIYDLLYDCPTTKTYKYTGWNFISATKKCEKLNDKKIKYPIYFKVIEDKNNPNFFSIKNRTFFSNKLNINVLSNKIFLTLNTDKFIYIDDENQKSQIVAALAHEFRHCIEMFANENIDSISIDTGNIEKIDIDIKNLFKQNELQKINRVIYLFSEAEERARIQGTVFYLKDIKKDNQNDFKKIYANIYEMINDTDAIHYLKEMETILLFFNSDIVEQKYDRLFQLAYFFKECNPKYTKIKIDKDDLKNINHIDEIFKHEQALLLKNILQMNLEVFKENLFSAVAYHI